MLSADTTATVLNLTANETGKRKKRNRRKNNTTTPHVIIVPEEYRTTPPPPTGERSAFVNCEITKEFNFERRIKQIGRSRNKRKPDIYDEEELFKWYVFNLNVLFHLLILCFLSLVCYENNFCLLPPSVYATKNRTYAIVSNCGTLNKDFAGSRHLCHYQCVREYKKFLEDNNLPLTCPCCRG